MKTIRLIGLILLLLTGCTGSAPFSPDFDLGVIKTTGTSNKSVIEFYREDLSKVSSIALPYGSMDYHGFTEPIILDGHLFVVPQGLFTKKDLGIVLDLDLKTGTQQKVSFNRINITSTAVTGKYIYAASNLNQTVYLDRYDRTSQKIDTVTLDGWMLLYVEAHNGQLIATAMDVTSGEPSGASLLKFDFEAGKLEVVADLTPYVFEKEAPIHILSHGSEVYMTSNDQLLIYSDATKTITAEKLPDQMARQILIQGSQLFILHSDIVSASRESSLTVFDLADSTMKNSSLGETIWQIALKGNQVFGLDLKDNAVHRYGMTPAGIAKEASQSLTPEQGFNISALFLK